MKKTHITRLLVLLQIGLFTSCNETIQKEEDPRYYVPLEVGNFYIYQVKEENFFSGVSQPTIRNYQEKEEITAYKGNNLFIVTSYNRTNAGATWTKDKEYSMQLFPDRLIKTIDNKDYVYMIFPIIPFNDWNGNTYNNLEEKLYQYTEISGTDTINEMVFKNTLKVVEDNSFYQEDILGLDRTERLLSYQIGLIYEQQSALQYCQETDDCIGQKIIESGTRKTREIVAYSVP